MSWFYAGPDAKPVGPLSLEELHARRQSGAVLPETFVIEQSPGTIGTWKRYQDLFPAAAPVHSLPPVPVAAPYTPPPAPPLPTPPPVPAPHPLFPSAVYAPTHPIRPPAPLAPVAHPVVHHDHLQPPHRTNAWCQWGFGLGLGSLVGSFFCIGALLAPFGFVASTIGFIHVTKHRGEHGRGLAIAGIAISSFVLVCVLAVGLFYVALPHIQAYERTATEQTSNDSE